MNNMFESFEQPRELPGKDDSSSPEIDFDEIFADTPPPSPEDLAKSHAARKAMEEGFEGFDKHGSEADKKALAQEKRAELLNEIRGNA